MQTPRTFVVETPALVRGLRDFLFDVSTANRTGSMVACFKQKLGVFTAYLQQ